MSKDQTQTKPRTRIEVPVEFDDVPGQPKQPNSVVCCAEMPVRLYERAVQHMTPEWKFVNFALMKPDGWAESLTPESFELVASAVKEVNSRFFASMARQVDTARRIGVAGPPV